MICSTTVHPHTQTVFFTDASLSACTLRALLAFYLGFCVRTTSDTQVYWAHKVSPSFTLIFVPMSLWNLSGKCVSLTPPPPSPASGRSAGRHQYSGVSLLFSSFPYSLLGIDTWAEATALSGGGRFNLQVPVFCHTHRHSCECIAKLGTCSSSQKRRK